MPAPATARKGRLQTQEWRSDGRAEWDGAECTYYRRAGAMPAAVVAGDGCGFVHAVWELVLSPGPEYSHSTRQHSDERGGRIWRALWRLQATIPTHRAVRASAPKEPAGLA
jgi:hypothetical protein